MTTRPSASIAPQRHRKFRLAACRQARLRALPQSHLRGIERCSATRSVIGVTARPQSHLRGIESEVYDVAGSGGAAGASIAPQRHRKTSAEHEDSAFADPASIAPQRHRKGVLHHVAGAAADRPQSHLRGIERMMDVHSTPPLDEHCLNRTSEASKVHVGTVRHGRCVSAASIAPQRHRKFKTSPLVAFPFHASIAPQRHRK